MGGNGCAGRLYCYKGLALEKSTLEHMLYQVQQQAIEMYLPGVTREYGETMTGWLWEKIESRLLPASADIQREGQEETDQATSSKIMEENTEFLEAKLLEEIRKQGLRNRDMKIQEVWMPRAPRQSRQVQQEELRKIR